MNPKQTTIRVREDGVTVKRCFRCGSERPLDDYHKNKSRADGVSAACKSCSTVIQQEWQHRHPETHRAASKRWRDNNKEKSNALIITCKARNPEKYKAARRDYAIRNAERLHTYWAEYHATHIEERQAAGQRRNAAKRLRTTGDMTEVVAFYKRVRTARRIRCYWCREWVKKEDRQVDHIIPLASPSGTHTPQNLCCACRSCNQKKNAKMPEEFGGQMFIPLHGELMPAERKKHVARCIICEAEFEAFTPSARYDRPECRNKARALRQKSPDSLAKKVRAMFTRRRVRG